MTSTCSKALEADLLRPMVREAGGVQALASRMQSVETLIEEAGGIRELKDLVADAHGLRLRLDEVGGLQGLNHLVSQVNRLRSEQRENTELLAIINGPNGLKAKALKYDMLQQAFAAIERGPINEQSYTSRPKPVMGTSQAQVVRTSPRNHATSTAAARSSAPASEGVAAMNPERARMLSAAPRARDPDRDLYEPPPPKRRPSTKTGSNDVPLGKPRAGRGSSIEQGYGSQKRRHEEELQLGIAKRPRIDVGRASELVQATLQGKPKGASSESTYGRLQPVSEDTPWQERFNNLLQRPPTAPTSGTASERAPSRESVFQEHLPTVKIERRERY